MLEDVKKITLSHEEWEGSICIGTTEQEIMAVWESLFKLKDGRYIVRILNWFEDNECTLYEVSKERAKGSYYRIELVQGIETEMEELEE